jgi:UDP-4-amino-4,6-dideoxy-N-acetyl-beta-L-altrosamine transaminase
MAFIPYGRQSIDEDDIAAVVAVLRSDYLTTGPTINKFETELKARVGAAHAIVCSSGTAGLHLAMLALDFAPGDVAIVPSMTFAATANAARYVGGEVVFADVDPATGLMRAGDFEAALVRAMGKKVKAVLPVLLGGQGTDAAKIFEIASARGIAVVEDACHAIGTRYRHGNATWRVGECRHSHASVFSFHPVKAVTMGEGGAVTTNDDAYAAQVRRLCSHGIEREPASMQNRAAASDGNGSANPWYYELAELGFNYRATDIHCALGLSQLGRLDQFVARRAELVARYDRLLAVARVPDYEPGWHLYGVRIDFAALGKSRAAVINALRGQGIGTQVHYIPLHQQPYYVARYGASSLPGAERYYAQTLSLPLYPQLTDAEQDRVVAVLKDQLRG